MFRAEAVVLGSLDDPDIVRLYEYVESPAGAAIVMEFIDGVSLREILLHQGSTTAEAALVVLQGSLLGLAAAHRRGVVHRDYKPANVLVNGDGASKLTDFGLAVRAGDRPVPAGTLLYVAPEQIAGAPASPAGDVYAATATFYECLAGRPPFSGESAELLRQHQRRAAAPGPGARAAAAADGRRNGQGPRPPPGRRDLLCHRTADGGIRCLRPGLGRTRPFAPWRGGAAAGGAVAIGRGARGAGHRRAPGLPARRHGPAQLAYPAPQAPQAHEAYQAGPCGHRGRYRRHDRGGRRGSRRDRPAARPTSPQTTRSMRCSQFRSSRHLRHRHRYHPRHHLPRPRPRRRRPSVSPSPSPSPTPTQTPTQTVSPPPPPPPPPASVTVTVPASGGWIDTGIQLHAGDSLDITARGSWTAGRGGYTGPDGYATEFADNFFNVQDVGVCAYCATTMAPHWEL